MIAEIAAFSVPPVVKRVFVPLPLKVAFDRFTAGLGTWWPIATKSLSAENAVEVTMEPRIGGRLIERDRNGAEHLWGTIQHWNPPNRVVFTWHVGRSPEKAQMVDVSFVSAGTEATEVTLVHSGWEILGEDAQAARESYDGGWEIVFCREYANVGRAT